MDDLDLTDELDSEGWAAVTQHGLSWRVVRGDQMMHSASMVDGREIDGEFGHSAMLFTD